MSSHPRNFALRARQIVVRPGQQPIKDAVLIARNGLVEKVGPWKSIKTDLAGLPLTDLGRATVVPGLINSHAHLELSHLEGKVPGGDGFAAWVSDLVAASLTNLDKEELDKAAALMAATGTVFVCDIGSRNAPAVRQALDAHGLDGFHGLEFFGYDHPGSGPAPKPDSDFTDWPFDTKGLPRDRVLAAGHALYSTSPEILVNAKNWCRAAGKPFFMHLAESPDEIDLLTAGRGGMAEILSRHVLPRDWTPPGKRPIPLARDLGLLGPGTVAVHCVQAEPAEVRILAETGTAICLCPKSNAYIGVGQAPWDQYAKTDALVCLGTDSLASNTSLDLWDEARYILARSSDLAPADVLAWMTTNPAKALGLEKYLGTLEPGHKARYALVPGDMSLSEK